ncbi:MAG TPA: tetratricopeptide repeat protein [Cytophagaceae bacterium]|jgi:tetratricopeptide (TPR) repeat protein
MCKSFKAIFLLIPFVILLIVGANVASAEDLNKVFTNANQAYQKGQYENAIKSYESILAQNKESYDLYFNLGNAYYKTGNIPKAILNYERAKTLEPNDEDVLFNLGMSNLKVTDKIDVLPEFFLNSWWKDISESKSSNFWAWITILLFWLVFFTIVLFLMVRSENFKRLSLAGIILSLVLFGFCFLLASHQYQHQAHSKHAIIFSPNLYVKSSPTAKSTDLFILHEGTKVKILDEVGTWRKIRIANGNEGWTEAEGLEII